MFLQTFPLLKNNLLGLEGKPAPLRKMGLQNVGKFSHFGMAVLRRGVRVKKETAIGRFA